MDIRFILRLVAGTIFLLAGLSILVTAQTRDMILAPILIAAGLAFLIVGILQSRKSRDGPLQDERTMRIAVSGLAYSWKVSIISIALLFYVDYFGIFPMSGYIAFAASTMILAFSAILFQRYFAWKGDVRY